MTQFFILLIASSIANAFSAFAGGGAYLKGNKVIKKAFEALTLVVGLKLLFD
ncbi:MAG: hypothetical protein PHC51_05635 [bacterium]|nr:hypothetical protein [bacterium]